MQDAVGDPEHHAIGQVRHQESDQIAPAEAERERTRRGERGSGSQAHLRDERHICATDEPMYDAAEGAPRPQVTGRAEQLESGRVVDGDREADHEVEELAKDSIVRPPSADGAPDRRLVELWPKTDRGGAGAENAHHRTTQESRHKRWT